MKILSLGAGVQSSALLLLAVKREIECDGIMFADTGVEKPTTYEFLEELKKIVKEATIPYQEVAYKGGATLYDYCIKYRVMPSVIRRWCTDEFKISPIAKALKGQDAEVMVGFSFDEQHRAKRGYQLPYKRVFPLIELRLTQWDCGQIIIGYGLPVPTKSSCYLCPFQHPNSWRWIKRTFPDLFAKALEVEENFYRRKPEKRDFMGLFSGLPLWKAMGEGEQGLLMPWVENIGCYSGHCFR